MHELEPHYNWRGYYTAEADALSPFYEREYNEFAYTDTIYNYYIHPQWDNIGSPTLFMKILFVDYAKGVCIFEMIGEWNDAINNDIMFLKRDIVDTLIQEGISKFIVIGENVMNFHASDDCYYEEWFEDVEEGWIAFVNFREHVQKELESARIDHYLVLRGELEDVEWRSLHPSIFCEKIEDYVQKRLM
jgi:hypothetical protein